jgi:hypothetical protein
MCVCVCVCVCVCIKKFYNMEPQNCSVISPFRASDGVPGTATRRRNGRSRVQIPVKERYFYVLDNVHISFVTHLVSYSMDILSGG